jgi:hypothetical protein
VWELRGASTATGNPSHARPAAALPMLAIATPPTPPPLLFFPPSFCDVAFLVWCK